MEILKLTWVKGSVTLNGGKETVCEMCLANEASVVWKRRYICSICYGKIKRIDKAKKLLERKLRKAENNDSQKWEKDSLMQRIETLKSKKKEIEEQWD